MANIYDLLALGRTDPEILKAVLADEKKVSEFGVTSAQLETLRSMDPEHVRVIMRAIDERLRVGPVAGTNACPGTFACFGAKQPMETLR